jgi:hypothetical protein
LLYGFLGFHVLLNSNFIGLLVSFFTVSLANSIDIFFGMKNGGYFLAPKPFGLSGYPELVNIYSTKILIGVLPKNGIVKNHSPKNCMSIHHTDLSLFLKPSYSLQPMAQVAKFGEGRDGVTHPGALQVSKRNSRSH